MTTYLTEKQDVINWFLAKENMSREKLLGLLYYAHAWTIALFNESESNIQVKLADHIEFTPGISFPMERGVLDTYKDGSVDIAQYTGSIAEFDEGTCDLLNDVWAVYGGFKDYELSILVKQESPYQKARGDAQLLDVVKTKIKDDDMFDCYHARIEQSDA